MMATMDAQMSDAPVPVPVQLIEATARLLAQDGVEALSVKRVTAEIGVSTMAVYTHFGGLRELVRAVVAEGFRRLDARLNAVPLNEDLIAYLGSLGAAYRVNALANPNLYTVMFGSASLGGYRLTGEELAQGRYTFDIFADAVAQAMDQGQLHLGDPLLAAGQLWTAIHGFVTLELAGYFDTNQPYITDEQMPVQKILLPLLAHLIIGLGADPAAALGAGAAYATEDLRSTSVPNERA